LYRDVELPVAEVLYRMERSGILIDVFALAKQSEELGRQVCIELQAEAHALAGQPFNLEFAQAACRNSVRQAGLAGGEKDAVGRAIHR
jgi:DNA polymerase I-like protein with 3'-5' exonuclease and polymerase domains